MSAASTRARSRWSGTTRSAPRPEAWVWAAAWARAVGQSVAGAADQTARGEPPAARWARNAAAGSWPAQAAAAAVRVERDGAVRLRGRLGLGGGVARRHGQPEHVGPASGVPLGDGGGQRCHLGREHRLGADDAAQRREPAGVVGLGDALDDVAVDVLPGEPDLHPRPRHRRVGVLDGDEVVEGAVEVGQRQVDQHPRDRVGRRRLDVGGLAGAGRGRLRLRVGDRGPETGQHLGLVGHG